MLGFKNFHERLLNLSISHTWRGHGSAIFLELGYLSPSTKLDGSAGEPTGEVSIMLPWSWRIEKPRSILGGSWSSDRKITSLLSVLRGHTVTEAALFGRLPELHLSLSNGFHVLSFMTAEGQPEWAIICTSLGATLCVKRGQIVLESLAT